MEPAIRMGEEAIQIEVGPFGTVGRAQVHGLPVGAAVLRRQHQRPQAHGHALPSVKEMQG